MSSLLKSPEHWMALALKEAHKARLRGEVPVGALIVKNNKVISRGFNLKESKNNPILHAELIAIQKASLKLKSWRLTDCDMYVTLEPCLMCSGAIIQARLRHIYIATEDPKAGTCCSLYQVFDDKRFNHQPKWQTGILKEESSLLLKNFFKELRQQKKIKAKTMS